MFFFAMCDGVFFFQIVSYLSKVFFFRGVFFFHRGPFFFFQNMFSQRFCFFFFLRFFPFPRVFLSNFSQKVFSEMFLWGFFSRFFFPSVFFLIVFSFFRRVLFFSVFFSKFFFPRRFFIRVISSKKFFCKKGVFFSRLVCVFFLKEIGFQFFERIWFCSSFSNGFCFWCFCKTQGTFFADWFFLQKVVFSILFQMVFFPKVFPFKLFSNVFLQRVLRVFLKKKQMFIFQKI